MVIYYHHERRPSPSVIRGTEYSFLKQVRFAESGLTPTDAL